MEIFMQLLPKLGVALVLLALSGCGKVPLSTLVTLATLDPSSADPAGFGAAVRQPAWLATPAGGVTLTLTIARGGASKPEVHSFVLEEVRDPAELAKVDQYRRQGDTLTVYRPTATDAQAMRQLQSSTRGASGGSSSIGVAAKACTQGAMPSGPVLTSTYLKVAAGGAYLPVLEDIDLRAELGDGVLAEQVPACG
jgi:hypothetical protein